MSTSETTQNHEPRGFVQAITGVGMKTALPRTSGSLDTKTAFYSQPTEKEVIHLTTVSFSFAFN